MKFVVSASSQTCLVRQTLLTANPSLNQALHCSSSLLYPQRFEAYPSSQTKFLVCTDSLAAAATATLHDGNGSFFFAWREGGSFKNNPAAAAAAAAAEGMFLGSFCSFCLWRWALCGFRCLSGADRHDELLAPRGGLCTCRTQKNR